MKTIHALNISFYLNAQLITTQVHPELTALKLIREHFGLTGTKESCAEGDCGSCTIALGKWENNNFIYRAINSCILPAAKLHRTHVITIEGLSQNKQLHLIQQKMLENRATQCGYCTPGIIMALFCLLTTNKNPTQAEIYSALEGNLCRCTGYVQINQAANAIRKLTAKTKNQTELKQLIFPTYVKQIKSKLKNTPKNSLKLKTTKINSNDFTITETYHIPNNLTTAFNLLAKFKSNAKMINGGSDLIVAANIHNDHNQHLIDISHIQSLTKISVTKTKISIGGAVTFAQIAANKSIKQKLPFLVNAIPQIASTQIRNIATPAGNIANASPIADAACILLGLNAKLILQTKTNQRKIALVNFYESYKKTKLKAQEIITAIEIPLPQLKFASFEKTAKRNAVDIATTNSVVTLEFKNKIITKCRIVFGGVAPYPKLAKKCATFLCGKKLDSKIITQAAQIALQEFQPISDVRGNKDYRALLIKNHLIKHLNQAR